MAASEADVRKLRRMCNENDDTSAYDDIDLTQYVESYPIADSDGNEPADSDWVAVYDLAAAASDVWSEKAAIAAQDYDFSDNGASFTRSQVYEQCMKMSRYHASRKAIGSVKVYVSPKPRPGDAWIGNQAAIEGRYDISQ